MTFVLHRVETAGGKGSEAGLPHVFFSAFVFDLLVRHSLCNSRLIHHLLLRPSHGNQHFSSPKQITAFLSGSCLSVRSSPTCLSKSDFPYSRKVLLHTPEERMFYAETERNLERPPGGLHVPLTQSHSDSVAMLEQCGGNAVLTQPSGPRAEIFPMVEHMETPGRHWKPS